MGRKPQDPTLKQALVLSSFNSVRELMEQGFPKSHACDKLRICRAWFHKNISPEQKKILDEIYFSFSQGSSSTKWKVEKA